MNRIHVLIAVDAIGALSASTLEGYVYLVDTNHYLGSWQEGESALITACQDGQEITWSVAPVDAGSAVGITGFSGPLVDQHICTPAQDPYAGDTVWNGRIQSQGEYSLYNYTVTLELNSSSLNFSSSIKVV